MKTRDIQIACADCGQWFWWTVGQQAWFQRQGLYPPKRCASCCTARQQVTESVQLSASREIRLGFHQGLLTTLVGFVVAVTVATAPTLMEKGLSFIERTNGSSARPKLDMQLQHREFLAQTGWLSYVEGHVDDIEYVPSEWFEVGSTRAIGVAERTWSGRRVIRVATVNHSDVEIVSVIVHEAAHLEGLARAGTYFDEEYANRVRDQFLEHLRARRRWNGER